MDPATGALLASLGIQVGSAIYNEIAGARDRAEQQALLRNVLNEFQSAELPDLRHLEAEQLGDTAFAGVEADPDIAQSRAMQLEAMDLLKNRYSSGRMSLEDRALQNEALSNSATAENAGRLRIEDDMAARGTGRGGAAIALQAQNAQAGANRAAKVGADAAGNAQRQAMDAILSRGRLASEVRGQDTALKGATAGARDSIARYNAAGRDAAKRYNVGIPQQQFDNRLRKAAGISNATHGVVNQIGNESDDRSRFVGGMGAAASEAGQTYARSRNAKKRF